MFLVYELSILCFLLSLWNIVLLKKIKVSLLLLKKQYFKNSITRGWSHGSEDKVITILTEL